MKQLIQNITLPFYILKYLPLYVILLIQANLLKNKEAALFYDDIEHFHLGFFRLLQRRPYYVMLLYRRLGYVSCLFKWLCGTYMITIPNKKYPFGGGVHLEHPHGTHINAKFIGNNFSCAHNVNSPVKNVLIV